MRADMAKVIHERPRFQSGLRGKASGARKQIGRLGPDNLPHREGIKGRLHTARFGISKHSKRHLAPLLRFLGRNVGRPWDTVHAEICEQLRLDSAPQRHVRVDLDCRVMTNVLLIDGVPCCGEGGRNYGTPLNARLTQWRFYVCPRSGLLRRLAPRASKQQPHPSSPRPTLPPVGLGSLCQYHFLRGRWCEVRLEPFAPNGPWPSRYPAPSPGRDVLLDKPILSDVAQSRYGVMAYAAAVRPLGRREQTSLPLPTPPPRCGRLPNLVR